MKDNRDILNEAFFKKSSYADKLNKKMPQYSPVDVKNSTSYASNGVPLPAYQVTDTAEVKKRLSGLFGATFGNNNIRNMASRAIKEFPIIISDNVAPETAIMLKKLVEEQYAEYINLLISNQVVNLADYSTNDENGNIAIQALDSISGTDFKKSRISNIAARNDNITVDDVFANTPLYNLLRENQLVLNTGDSITDALLENAVVIPSDHVAAFIPFINEAGTTIEREFISGKKEAEVEKEFKLNSLFTNTGKDVIKSQNDNDLIRGYRGLDKDGKEVYDKITTADIVLDRDRFDAAVNRSVGETLMLPENKVILENMQYATFLLQSRMISGKEYYNYLTKRLGIPVSDKARIELMSRFKIANIIKYGQDGKNILVSDAEIKAISSNKIYIDKLVKEIGKPSIKDVLSTTAKVTGAGAAAGLGGLGIAALFSGPLGLGILAGAAVGSVSYLLYKLLTRKKKEVDIEPNMNIEGWERVEYLISLVKQQRVELTNSSKKDKDIFINTAVEDKYETPSGNIKTGTHYISTQDYVEKNKNKNDKYLTFQKDFDAAILDTTKMVNTALTESVNVNNTNDTNGFTFFEVGNKAKTNLLEDLADTISECMKEKGLRAQILTEKVLAKTSMPLTVKYVNSKNDKDILLTPSFMARDSYAYGSTEIERKENKDRKYNQPLIITVKFKERFSDGKYADNELTAVIGVLGKIIRIPSAEMEYILKENIEGNTIEGIFKNPSIKDTVADLLSTSKISKDLKNLPQSADVWHNLEKVATLAAANKISGRRNNNIANAHIIFSQKEIDDVRNETGVDYLKDTKKAVSLMKRYSAFTLMVANDAGQRVAIMDDQDNISWDVVPYSAVMGKDSGDQLSAALTKMMRL